MALSLVNGPVSIFDAAVQDLRLYELFAKARAGSIAAIHLLHGGPQFTATAKTTDNSAASEVIDLTDKGVTFPAGTFRKVRFKSTARTDNDVWIQEWEQWVWGNDGTTPKLVGTAKLCNAVGEINGTVVQYGNCRAQATYSQDTATAVAANSTAGSSLGNNSTNTITLTHPIARTAVGSKYIRGINASADVATATEQLHVTGYVAGGTSTTIVLFAADTATPSADGFDDVGVLDVEFFILPPPSIALVMNSNNVEVHCGHDATDDVYHDVEVFVGQVEHRPVVAD